MPTRSFLGGDLFQKLSFWLGIAFVIRLISSWTHYGYLHPDEWYQTAELGNLLLRGIAANTQEISLHLRNLTWPTLLMLPLLPNDPDTRVMLVQLFTGCLDLLFIGAWFSALKRYELPVPLGMALITFLPFVPSDGVRASGEHLSMIAFWLSLHCYDQKRMGLCGLFCVAIGAFRYPCFLLSLGFLPFGVRDLKFWCGVVAGAILFGLPDYFVYGRAWESLYMYLAYNVFSGVGASQFGTQSAIIYVQYFTGKWGGLLLPITLPLVVGFQKGIEWGFKNKKPWAYSFLFFILGHLLIGHKEGRFLAPIEWLGVFIGLIGIHHFNWKKTSAPWITVWIVRIKKLAIPWGVAVILLFLKDLWGHNWIAQGTFLEMSSHLRKHPQTCAIISVHKPLSIDLPKNPLIYGYFPSERKAPSFEQTKTRPLLWVPSPNTNSTCKDSLLLHLHKPDPAWEQSGCTLVPSGVLNYVPQKYWSYVLKKGWVAGPWYHCPKAENILTHFGDTKTREIFATQFPKISTLPPLLNAKSGIHALQSQDQRDGTIGEWK